MQLGASPDVGRKTFAFTPRRMRADAAAFYMGVSVSLFLDRVKKAIYPAGAKDGGVTVWLRDDLDRIIDSQFGVEPASRGLVSKADEDPFLQRFRRAS